MGFRLVPKSMTLDDIKRRDGPYIRYFTEFRGQLRQSG